MCRRRARITVGVERERERGQEDTSEVQEATKAWGDRKGKRREKRRREITNIIVKSKIYMLRKVYFKVN